MGITGINYQPKFQIYGKIDQMFQTTNQPALENGPVEILDLPSYKMVDLSVVM